MIETVNAHAAGCLNQINKPNNVTKTTHCPRHKRLFSLSWLYSDWLQKLRSHAITQQAEARVLSEFLTATTSSVEVYLSTGI